MERPEFQKWICSKRGCAASSAATVWYNLKRAQKMAKTTKKLGKSAKWVNIKVVEKIHSLPRTSARNQLISLLTYLREADDVKPKVLEMVEQDLKQKSKEVDAFYNSQQKSEKQAANWVEYPKIKAFHKRMQDEVRASGLWTSPMTPQSRKKLQKYLILSMHGPLMPPARLEHSSLVLGTPSTIDDTKNWLYKKKRKWLIEINQSKISSKKGKQILDKIPKNMSALLSRYVRATGIKPGDPVFVDHKGVQLTRNAYSKRIRQMMHHEFGKNVGASLLRNIYLTSKYKNIPSLTDMQQTSNMMLHSVGTALGRYVKR